MELDVGLWSSLPSEVVERLLSFLPVPVLCRFRAVCKRWNSLITTPEFARLCIQNANQDVGYIAARLMENVANFKKSLGWCILDLNERRWYTIKHDGGELVEFPGYSGLLAMDGGLVCQYLEPEMTGVMITLSNPIAKTTATKMLPLPPCHLTTRYYPHLDLVVDNLASSYQIFLVNRGFNLMTPEDPVMRVYESATDLWRCATNPPFPVHLGVGFQVSSVMFQGLLYILFSSFDDREYWIFTYNFQEDAWRDTGVHIHSMLESAELIVSDNRLFLVSWFDVLDTFDRHNLSCWPLDISEILVADKAHRTVFRMSRALVLLIFNVEAPGRRRNGAPPIHSFGFGKSILLLSKMSGTSIVYDLVTSFWDILPTNPVGPVCLGRNLWYGKHMNLILPCTVW